MQTEPQTNRPRGPGAALSWLIPLAILAPAFMLAIVGNGGNLTLKSITSANTQLSSITVVKQATGGDGGFAFTGDLGGFTLITAGGTAQRVFADLAAGVYGLSEVAQTGWDLTGATCSDGSNPASIDLAPGENVTCTFTNTKLGSLTISKIAQGVDTSFAFTSSTLSPNSFSITTVNGTGSQVFPNLVPGIYDVAETPLAGWDMFLALCGGWGTPDRISIGPGENVTCNFLNAQRGSLTVVKQATGGDGSFAFTSQALGDFDITTSGGSGQRVFADLPLGTYDLSETAQAGWQLDGATCSNGSDPANVNIRAGENVTCTFANTKLARLTIVKVAENGNGVFPFFSQTLGDFTLATAGSLMRGTAQQVFPDLAAGIYDIQAPRPPTWVFVSQGCSDGSNPEAIDLAAGEDVTCTYVSRPEPTALDQVDEPEMLDRLFLPLIGR